MPRATISEHRGARPGRRWRAPAPGSRSRSAPARPARWSRLRAGAPDGVALGHRRLRAPGQPRSRRPRGVARKPAASSACAERGRRGCGAPSACSTVSRPSAPVAHGERERVRCRLRARPPGRRRRSAGSCRRARRRRQLAVDEHDQRAGLAPGPVPGADRPPGGPASGSAAPRVGRVGGREHQGRGCRSRRSRRAVGAQPVDRARRWRTGRRPAPRRSSRGGTGRSPRRPRAPGRPRRSRRGVRSADDRAAGDDAVAVEQRLGQRRAPAGSGRARARAAATSGRPTSAAVRRARPGEPAAGRAYRARVGAGAAGAVRRRDRRPAPAAGARVSLVTRPGPDQVPQRGRRAPVVDRPGRTADPVGRAGGRTARRRRSSASSTAVVHVGRRRARRRSGRVSGAVSARCSETQPSAPGRPRGRPTAPRRRGQLVEQRRGVVGDPAGRTSDSSAEAGTAHAGELLDHARARRRGRAGVGRRRAARPAGSGRAPPARPARPRWRSRGQRAAAQHPQHLGVAPLGPGAAGPELALDHPARAPASRASVCCARRPRPSPSRAADVGGGERAVGAGVAADAGRRAGRRPAR